ncbi:hypothetical protein GNT65_02145 [Shewanella sp. JBTF-M18]|uniref:Uncharacterized protein n=1 Tax=Shewanella insulae TaxID=2681496 RepID=A0A6L7HT75_9GAMM|nr:hypothetical protein [Shewanella insulae]MXR67477.1 hypothetical protein [Shewanella insulae]
MLPKDSQSSWPHHNLDIDLGQLAFCEPVNEPEQNERAEQGSDAASVPLAKGPSSFGLSARIGWQELHIFLAVLLVHLVLLALLSWQFDGPYLAQDSTKGDKKAISAYMLTQAEFDAMRAKYRPAEATVKLPLTKLVQNESSQDALNQEAGVTQENQVPSEPSPEKLAPAIRATDSQGKVTQDKLTQDKVTQDKVTQPTVTHANATQTTNAPATDTSASNTSESRIVPETKPSDDIQKESGAFSFEGATGLNLAAEPAADSGAASAVAGDYMVRYRQSRLDELVERAASNATQKKSMSEMDGEMRGLVLPKENEYEAAITLDSKLDPNRIVKIGDTCYRVVSVATPINPHGENLGFPFKCGGDKVKQAIKDSLDKHLSMMGVKVKDKN